MGPGSRFAWPGRQLLNTPAMRIGCESSYAASSTFSTPRRILLRVHPAQGRLSDIVNNVLMPHPSVAHVRSSIVLDRLKESAKLPLRT
jgi:hypothetical protein